MQVLLLAEFASRLYGADKVDDFREIISSLVLPLIDSIEDTDERIQRLIDIAPCLYHYERALLKEYLTDLPVTTKDKAFVEIFEHLITNRPIGDPVAYDKVYFTIEFSRALELYELLAEISTDHLFHQYLDELVDALLRKNRLHSKQCVLDEKQALNIAIKLRTLVDTKLPDHRNIMHRGYKLVAYGSIAKLRAAVMNGRVVRAKAQWEQLVPSWQELVEMTRTLVSNLSDQILVLAWLAEKMAFDNISYAQKLLEEAKDMIASIPNVVDRSSRLLSLAEVWYVIDDSNSAKHFLRETMLSLQSWNSEQSQETIIEHVLEVAHSIDPEFASSLTASIDNPIVEHDSELGLLIKDLHKKPAEIHNRDIETEDKALVLSRLSAQMLKSLCLGRGQIQTEHHVAYMLNSVCRSKFEYVYSVLAWSIQNEIERTRVRHGAALSKVINGILDAIEMTMKIGYLLNSPDEQLSAFRQRPTKIPDSLQFFALGSGKEALLALQSWIQMHVHDYLRIYDPYFSISDLHVLKNLGTDVRVIIITSWKAQDDVTVGNSKALKQVYDLAWGQLSDQAPPHTQIYVFGIESDGDSPLHERFYVTAHERGIRLGTSTGGLGNKYSDIREMNSEETVAIEAEYINKMILHPPRTFKNELLLNSVITLC